MGQPLSLADLGRIQPDQPQYGLGSLAQLGQMSPEQLRGIQDQMVSYQEQLKRASPIINPGVTWGGRDRNAVHPEDVQRDRVYGPMFSQENL